MAKRSSKDTKEHWFLQVATMLEIEDHKQENYNFITFENLVKVFEVLRIEKDVRVKSFSPTRQEYLEEICKFISPTYINNTGRVILPPRIYDVQDGVTDITKNSGTSEVENEPEPEIIPLYSVNTGKTTTLFWKGIKHAYESDDVELTTDAERIMVVEVIQTTYGKLKSENGEIMLYPDEDTPAEIIRLHVPSFQRPFVWNKTQWHLWMDSIKLGIPTPPIIIAENKACDRYEIIDGQQRTKSMLKLRDDIEFQQRMKIKEIDKLKQLIDKYPLVVYSLRQAEGLDEERLELYWDLVKKTFERLNKGGKRLRPVEIRAARYNETSLHKRVVNQIEKIVNQTHPRYQYAKQMFEFYPSKSASRSQKSGEKRLTNEEIKLYDVITRRLAYSSYSDEDTPTSNKCIESHFKATKNNDGKIDDEIERMIHSIETATEIFGPEEIISQPPKSSAHSSVKNPRSTGFILTTLTIALEYSRYSMSPRDFYELASKHASEIRKSWEVFYWDQIDGMNQSSTNVWRMQREWCEIVNGILSP